MDDKAPLTDKQRHLLDAAERLFAAKGYDGTSVRDLAQAADVNVSMISYYFGSKEGLLRALFELRIKTLLVQFEDLVRQKDLTPLQKLERVVDMYVERVFSKTHFHKIMIQETSLLESSTLRSYILDYKKRNLAFIRTLVALGVRAGAFRRGADVSFLMMTLVGTANHAVAGKSYYRELNGLQNESDDVYQAHLKKKLSTYLKTLFKSYLTHDADERI